MHFRCIEQFANASHKLLFLQVTVSSVVFLDECGRRVQILPFLYLRRAAFSSAHSEGMVLSTAFHDRFFLCGERHECLNEIVAAANDAGVELYKTSSTITALQLRLQNTQVLDRASVIRFDVKKARNTEGNGDAAPGSEGSDGAKKAYKKIQLILQGDAIVEMHRSMRTVIARPYSALLAIVRPDWDPRTLVLEFKQEDTLVLDVEGRDQLVTLLLLCFLGVRTPNTAANYNAAGDQRAKVIQHFVHNGTLHHAIVDLIPASFAASNNSTFMANSSTVGEAFWMADPDVVQTPPSSLSSSQSSILCTKEARVQNEINVVFYETLLTLHHLLVFLKSTAKMQRASRDRQNYIAGANRQIQHGNYSDVPAEKNTDALAVKLLEKYRFLMDSIVDVRLVRMAETSVALVQFVLNHFATKTTASQLQLGPTDNQLSHSSDREFYDSRNKRLAMPPPSALTQPWRDY
ncbi:Cytochrome b5 isoform B [Phytophthora cinnamomi]|uniref:Cytochrome b5 isoform B n=1 Tax=Phytophthora cinnamomi TaxID=4785 RepID=UPI003559957E|nr:Cytochrome b5 isoform B [Phytophthora cinnamomi]